MKTEPLNTPCVGMMIFSHDANLMAEVTSVGEEGVFNFHVMNGLWSGRIDPGTMTIFAPSGPREKQFENDFERVTEVDQETHFRYYMKHSRYENFSVEGDTEARPLPESPEEAAETKKKLRKADEITTELGSLRTSSEGGEGQEGVVDRLIVEARRLHDMDDPEVDDEPCF